MMSMKQIRNTIQRDIVLQTVQELVGHHPTAEDIYQAVIQKKPRISRGTVYRNLNVLCDLGIVIKVTIEGGADRFDCVTVHHAHFECRQCHRIFDVALSPVMLPQESQEEGFIVESDATLFKGLCPECAKKRKGVDLK